nr:hypothetical protein [uncultured Undibacterium sp.]
MRITFVSQLDVFAAFQISAFAISTIIGPVETSAPNNAVGRYALHIKR